MDIIIYFIALVFFIDALYIFPVILWTNNEIWAYESDHNSNVFIAFVCI